MNVTLEIGEYRKFLTNFHGELVENSDEAQKLSSRSWSFDPIVLLFIT